MTRCRCAAWVRAPGQGVRSDAGTAAVAGAQPEPARTAWSAVRLRRGGPGLPRKDRPSLLSRCAALGHHARLAPTAPMHATAKRSHLHRATHPCPPAGSLARAGPARPRTHVALLAHRALLQTKLPLGHVHCLGVQCPALGVQLPLCASPAPAGRRHCPQTAVHLTVAATLGRLSTFSGPAIRASCASHYLPLRGSPRPAWWPVRRFGHGADSPCAQAPWMLQTMKAGREPYDRLLTSPATAPVAPEAASAPPAAAAPGW